MPLSTLQIFPRELNRNDIIVERTPRGKSLTYQISEVANNACSSPNCTHVVTRGGAVWCYDNTSQIEVIG